MHGEVRDERPGNDDAPEAAYLSGSVKELLIN